MITLGRTKGLNMAQRHGRGGGRGAGGSRAGSGARAGSQARSGPPEQRTPAPNRVRVREVIEPVVVDAGYDLDGLSLSRAGRRHLVRLTVDRDGGLNLDAVADMSRLVSAALDAVEAGGEVLFVGEYELQVSSPGVDRPLTLPRHWRRNVGRLVQVRVGDKQLTGRVLKADDDGVVLSADGTDHEVPYAGLGTGKIQLEFSRLEAISDDDLAPIDGAEEYDDDDADDDFEEDEE
jgi:ribosome maturation factor RimP